jgi:hypothetical protein
MIRSKPTCVGVCALAKDLPTASQVIVSCASFAPAATDGGAWFTAPFLVHVWSGRAHATSRRVVAKVEDIFALDTLPRCDCEGNRRGAGQREEAEEREREAVWAFCPQRGGVTAVRQTRRRCHVACPVCSTARWTTHFDQKTQTGAWAATLGGSMDLGEQEILAIGWVSREGKGVG